MQSTNRKIESLGLVFWAVVAEIQVSARNTEATNSDSVDYPGLGLQSSEALAKNGSVVYSDSRTMYKRKEVIGLVVAARSISTTSLVQSPAYLIALFLSGRSIVDAPVHSAPIPFVLCCNPLRV